MTTKNDYRKILEMTEAEFNQEKNRRLINMLLFSTLAIFSVESLLMVVLELILNIPEPIVWFIDGLILVVLLFPLNYIFIVRPMMQQIIDHRRTNLDLVKANEVLERFFSISDLMIAYMDADFNFIRVNRAYAKSNQLEPDYFVGKNHFALFPHAENEVIFKTVMRTGVPYNVIEKPFTYADHPEWGTTYWDWSLLPVKSQDGLVKEIILVLIDATARKKAQLALAESERRFHAVFDQTFQQSGLLDPSGRVIVANQTTLDFTGVGHADIYEKPLWELPWWDPAPEEIMALQSSVLQAVKGATVRGVHPMRSATGEMAVMDMTVKPMLDENGNPIMLIFEARDITDRVRYEEAIKRSEEEIKRLYQGEIRAHDLAEALRKAALTISSSLNIGTVLDNLLDSIYAVIPYSSAHIELLEDEEHLFVRLARGEENWPENNRILGRHLEVNELSIFHPLLKNRQVIQCADTTDYKGSRYFPGKQLVGSWVATPLLAGDQIIGLTILTHSQANFFTPAWVDWATTLTNQAAIAIQNAWLFEQVRDGREHLQALSRRLVEVQESERHYIARELHDDAGQALASLMVGLRLLERDGGDREAVIARSQELKQIADSVLENLHRLAVDLRPTALDHLGLVAALRQHTERISSQHNLAVQFEVIGKIDRLPDEMETAIYRIVQEALTNVVRHARATRAGVLLERRDETLVVIVEDNGVGFDPQVPKENQLGMVGARERADMLGGTIQVESSPGKGTTIVLEVPWPFES